MRPLICETSELWELPAEELRQVIEAAGDDARAEAINVLIAGSGSPEVILGAYVSACWDGSRRSAAARRKRGRATPAAITDIPDAPHKRLEYLRRSIDAISLSALLDLFSLASAAAGPGVLRRASTAILDGQEFQEPEREHLLTLIGAEDSELEQLRVLARIQQVTRRLMTEVTRDARNAGESWADIGIALGFSGDTARKRYDRSTT